jgi:hypothetical protein
MNDITTSKSNTLKGGVVGVHCRSCTCSYSSSIPRRMRQALTIPAEVPTKRERKTHCPSGETKSTCQVHVFTTKNRTRLTTCKPCSVKRFAYHGRGCETVFYNSLDLPSAERVVVRAVPYKL